VCADCLRGLKLIIGINKQFSAHYKNTFFTYRLNDENIIDSFTASLYIYLHYNNSTLDSEILENQQNPSN
jgi:hypothetical protein